MPEKLGAATTLEDIPEASWAKISKKRIFFGHQSIGFNIIDGIKDLMKKNPPYKLNIIETNNAVEFNAPIFAHARLGKNMDFKSKIQDFCTLMEKGIGDKTDFAFFKFCYVDVIECTDIDKMFAAYKNSLSYLNKMYPKTTFIHFTVPLTSLQNGPKAWIKKIIGMPVGGSLDNIKRNQFNELLKKKYNAKEPIFDIAKIESTFPNGTNSLFKRDGKSFNTLVPAFTYDGGHLNEIGRMIVAKYLLSFLVTLSN